MCIKPDHFSFEDDELNDSELENVGASFLSDPDVSILRYNFKLYFLKLTKLIDQTSFLSTCKQDLQTTFFTHKKLLGNIFGAPTKTIYDTEYL